MDDTVRVGGVEPVDDLFQEIEGHGGIDGTVVTNVLAQGVPVEEFHAQEPDFGSGGRDVAEELVDPADVWMGDGTGLLYFAAKSLDDCGALREVRADRFDGNSFAQLGVPGLVDFAHAAACNEALNAKSAVNNAVGLEGRGGLRRRSVGAR